MSAAPHGDTRPGRDAVITAARHYAEKKKPHSEARASAIKAAVLLPARPPDRPPSRGPRGRIIS